MSVTWDGHLWAWTCPRCGTGETGMVAAHHARTLHDEHQLLHQHPDLADEYLFLETDAPYMAVVPQPDIEPVEAQLVLYSVEREPRKKAS